MASPLNHAANRSGKIKNPSKKEAGLDVSHHTLVSREGRGENFFLDILFHRKSAIACQQHAWPLTSTNPLCLHELTVLNGVPNTQNPADS